MDCGRAQFPQDMGPGPGGPGPGPVAGSATHTVYQQFRERALAESQRKAELNRKQRELLLKMQGQYQCLCHQSPQQCPAHCPTGPTGPPGPPQQQWGPHQQYPMMPPPPPPHHMAMQPQKPAPPPHPQQPSYQLPPPMPAVQHPHPAAPHQAQPQQYVDLELQQRLMHNRLLEVHRQQQQRLLQQQQQHQQQLQQHTPQQNIQQQHHMQEQHPPQQQMNPQPQQMNPQPQQMNPQPLQINPQPLQMNPQPQHMNHQPQMNPQQQQMNPQPQRINPQPQQMNPQQQMNSQQQQMNSQQQQMNSQQQQMHRQRMQQLQSQQLLQKQQQHLLQKQQSQVQPMHMVAQHKQLQRQDQQQSHKMPYQQFEPMYMQQQPQQQQQQALHHQHQLPQLAPPQPQRPAQQVVEQQWHQPTKWPASQQQQHGQQPLRYQQQSVIHQTRVQWSWQEPSQTQRVPSFGTLPAHSGDTDVHRQTPVPTPVPTPAPTLPAASAPMRQPAVPAQAQRYTSAFPPTQQPRAWGLNAASPAPASEPQYHGVGHGGAGATTSTGFPGQPQYRAPAAVPLPHPARPALPAQRSPVIVGAKGPNPDRPGLQGGCAESVRPLEKMANLDAEPPPVKKMRIERVDSPVDLSVRTVRRSADSTAWEDSESLGPQQRSPSVMPRVDFVPDFNVSRFFPQALPSAGALPRPTCITSVGPPSPSPIPSSVLPPYSSNRNTLYPSNNMSYSVPDLTGYLQERPASLQVVPSEQRVSCSSEVLPARIRTKAEMKMLGPPQATMNSELSVQVADTCQEERDIIDLSPEPKDCDKSPPDHRKLVGGSRADVSIKGEAPELHTKQIEECVQSTSSCCREDSEDLKPEETDWGSACETFIRSLADTKSTGANNKPSRRKIASSNSLPPLKDTEIHPVVKEEPTSPEDRLEATVDVVESCVVSVKSEPTVPDQLPRKKRCVKTAQAAGAVKKPSKLSAINENSLKRRGRRKVNIVVTPSESELSDADDKKSKIPSLPRRTRLVKTSREGAQCKSLRVRKSLRSVCSVVSTRSKSMEHLKKEDSNANSGRVLTRNRSKAVNINIKNKIQPNQRKVLRSTEAANTKNKQECAQLDKKTLSDKETETPKALKVLSVQKLEKVIKPSTEKSTKPTGVENSVANVAKIRLRTRVVDIDQPLSSRPKGDGSDFRPGWEEEVFQYKRSLRMPSVLIGLSRGGNASDFDRCDSPANDTSDSFAPPPSASTNSDFDSVSNSTGFDSEEATSSTTLSTAITGKRSPFKQTLLDKLVEKASRNLNQKFKLAAAAKEIDKPTVNGVLKYRGRKPVTSFREAFRLNGMLQDEKSNSKPAKKFEKDHTDASIRAVFGGCEAVPLKRDKGSQEDTKKQIKKETVKSRHPEKSAPIKTSKVVRPGNLKKSKLVEAKPNLRKINEKLEEKSLDEGIVLRPRATRQVAIKRPGLRSAALIRRSKVVLNTKQRKSRCIALQGQHIDGSESPEPSMNPSMPPKPMIRKRMKLRRKFRSGFDYIRKKKKQAKKDSHDDMKKVKPEAITERPQMTEEQIQVFVRSLVVNRSHGDTVLHRASRLGYPEVVRYAIEKLNICPSVSDNAGYTPLHEAARRGHIEVAAILLELGADVSSSAQGGVRPLHEAAESNQTEILRLLLMYGADPTLATYSNLTPQSYAEPDSEAFYLLTHHLADVQGLPAPKWKFDGPSKIFDKETHPGDLVLQSPPAASDCESDIVGTEIFCSDVELPPLHTFLGESSSQLWVLLSDLMKIFNVSCKDAMLDKLSVSTGDQSLINETTCQTRSRELTVEDFLLQTRTLTLFSPCSNLPPPGGSIHLVEYNSRVRSLLNEELTTIS